MSEFSLENIEKWMGYTGEAGFNITGCDAVSEKTQAFLCIDHLIYKLKTIERETAEKCAQIALDLNDDGSWNGYHISRKIQETFGVNV